LESESLAALGMAGPQATAEATVAIACAHALENLGEALAAHVASATMTRSWEGGTYSEVGAVVEAPDGVKEQARRQGKVVRTWLSPADGAGHCLVEMSVESQGDPCMALPLRIANEDKSCGARKKPHWVDHPPAVAGAAVAVGVASIRAFPSNALEKTIEAGMTSLSKHLTARISGLSTRVRAATGYLLTSELVSTSAAHLSGTRLAAWWESPADGTTYALMCMPLAGVKLHLAGKLAEQPPGPPTQSDLSPEEFHRRQLDKLRHALDEQL
jgi:hypothetical protein